MLIPEDALPDACAHWYGVHVQPHFERRVAAEIQDKKIKVFAPTQEVIHQWSDRRQKVTCDLFPGYLFAHFADSLRTREAIRSCTGVYRILGGVRRIDPIPDEQIDAVRRIMDSRLPCFAHPYIPAGELVRVSRGALYGLEGIVVRVKTKARLVVSLDLLQRSVAVEFELEDLELLRRKPSSIEGVRQNSNCG